MFFVFFFRCDNISSTNLLKSVHPYIFQGKDEALLRENKRIAGWKTFIYWENPWPFTGSKETKDPPTHIAKKLTAKGGWGWLSRTKLADEGFWTLPIKIDASLLLVKCLKVLKLHCCQTILRKTNAKMVAYAASQPEKNHNNWKICLKAIELSWKAGLNTV